MNSPPILEPFFSWGLGGSLTANRSIISTHGHLQAHRLRPGTAGSSRTAWRCCGTPRRFWQKLGSRHGPRWSVPCLTPFFGWEGCPTEIEKQKKSWCPYSNLSTGGPKDLAEVLRLIWKTVLLERESVRFLFCFTWEVAVVCQASRWPDHIPFEIWFSPAQLMQQTYYVCYLSAGRVSLTAEGI